VQHCTCSLVKPLSRSCASKVIIFILGLPSISFSSSITDICPFFKTKNLLSEVKKIGDSNSLQKIIITMMSRTNARRRNCKKLRIMHVAVHSVLNVRWMTTNWSRSNLPFIYLYSADLR